MRISRTNLLVVTTLLILTAIYTWYRLQGDAVVLSNTSGQENGILVSAQGRGGILSDAAYTSASDKIDVGRLTAAPSRNEVIAFTNARPVAIKPMVSWCQVPTPSISHLPMKLKSL
jgi:hypothetical protein